MPIPALRTARLALRPATSDDLEALLVHWRRPQVRRYLCDDREIEREFAAALLAMTIESNAEGLGLWCVEVDGRFAGAGWLQRVSDGLRRVGSEVELLYSLEPEFWGRGYATEAAQALIRYAFERLGLARVLAGTDPPNAGSQAVLRRLGMRPFVPSPIEGVVYFVLDRESHVGASS